MTLCFMIPHLQHFAVVQQFSTLFVVKNLCQLFGLNGGVAGSDLYNGNNRINIQIQAKLSHLPINHKEGEVSLTLQ